MGHTLSPMTTANLGGAAVESKRARSWPCGGRASAYCKRQGEETDSEKCIFNSFAAGDSHRPSACAASRHSEECCGSTGYELGDVSW